MIWLIRHGQSATNAAGLLVGRSDPELTERGRAQARALAPLLEGVEQVWTSPLRRARETARLALPSVRARVVEELIEVDYGDMDGMALSAVSLEQWHAFETDHRVAFGGGESLASVDARIHALLDALLEDAESLLHRADAHLAVVSHLSPIKSAVAWALGVPGSVAWRTHLDNGSLSAIATRRRTPSLVHFTVVPPLGAAPGSPV